MREENESACENRLKFNKVMAKLELRDGDHV